jgi:hypothetical protein
MMSSDPPGTGRVHPRTVSSDRLANEAPQREVQSTEQAQQENFIEASFLFHLFHVAYGTP